MNDVEDGDTIVMSLIEFIHGAIVLISFACTLSEPEPPSSDVLLYPCTASTTTVTMPNGRAATKTASKTIYNATVSSYLKRCSTKSIVLTPPPSEPPPLESNRVVICYYLIDEGRVLHLTILYKYYTSIYKIRLHLLQLRLDSTTIIAFCPSVTFGTHKEYWWYLFTLSLCDSCASERYIESVYYEAFFALESIFTWSDFWNSITCTPHSRFFETMMSLYTVQTI